MKRSILIAVVLALAAAGWILSGQLGDGERQAEAQKPPVKLEARDHVATVRVRTQAAEPHVREIVLRGRTEADRAVSIKSETYGRIVELGADDGDTVTTGTLLARLSPEGRPAALTQAKALLEQRRIEHEAAQRLSKKGFRASTQLAAAKAALEAAQAAVRQAEVALENTVIEAPFDGIVDERMMELGDFAESSDALLRLVDLDPILVVAHVSERDIGRIRPGETASVRLVTGREITATIRFIASMAASETRTFRVELEAPNPEGAIADGISAEVRLPVEQTMAHKVSPAILTLDDDGVLGVKVVGADRHVEFYPARIAETGVNGVWLTGLPAEVTFITVGHEYVRVGQEVEPQDEADLEPAPAEAES